MGSERTLDLALTAQGAVGLIRGLLRCPRGNPRKDLAQVAQLVEQWIENPRVGGSIPPLGTISLKLKSTPLDAEAVS